MVPYKNMACVRCSLLRPGFVENLPSTFSLTIKYVKSSLDKKRSFGVDNSN